MPAKKAETRIVESELSYAIVGAFFTIYNRLGYGFLESVYLKCLEILLTRNGYLVEREVAFDISFDGQVVGRHRIDMLVEGRIIVEAKAGEQVSRFAKAQLRNYLAATNLRLGLLLHFGPRAEYHRVLGPVAIRDVEGQGRNADEQKATP
jgi:GxxExxY protein